MGIAVGGLVRFLRGWIAGAALAGALGLFAAPACATIAFERLAAGGHFTIWSAEDNGANPRQLTTPSIGGFQPLLAPDGSAVLFQSEPSSGNPTLDVVPAAGGPVTTLVSGGEPNIGQTAWSPDSKTIVTALKITPEREQLALIDVATHAMRVIASGNFEGVSFSPDSTKLAFARAPSARTFPTASDIYTVAVSGGKAVRITNNRRSTAPVWGPRQIAFARTVKARGRREDAPKSNIWLMNPNGSRARQLTRQKAPFLQMGPVPLAWSASGAQLLAEFTGQDTSYGQGVNPRTGAAHTFSRNRSIAFGFIATSISRDGKRVLGATGGFEPGPAHNVVTVPFGGGPMTVLVRNGFDPSWND